MKRLFLNLLVAFVLAFPIAMFAAAPANVTGIKLSRVDSGVQVEWKAVEGAVSAYRIFYGHVSILGNGGLYDDFETAPGNATSSILQTLPNAETLFVTVLAVGPNGEESPYFTEEATIKLDAVAVPAPVVPPSNPVAPTPAIPTPSPAPSEGSVQLLQAQAVSLTSVKLLFSGNIHIDEAKAAEAITIRHKDGKALVLKRLTAQGTSVTIDTEPQATGVPYAVEVGSAVSGTSDDGKSLPIDPSQRSLLFMGFSSAGTALSSTKTPSVTSVPEVGDLRLTAELEEKGKYTVKVAWTIPQGESVQAVVIKQSGDNAKTFGPLQEVKVPGTSVTIPGVTTPSLTVRIQVKLADGSLSRGVQKTISFPSGTVGNTIFLGQLTTGKTFYSSTKTKTGLPRSGAGIGIIVSVSVFGADFVRRMRKKERSNGITV